MLLVWSIVGSEIFMPLNFKTNQRLHFEKRLIKMESFYATWCIHQNDFVLFAFF
jgi:hypothetical protein